MPFDKSDLNKRWAALSQRERVFLLVGMAITVLGIGYLFLMAPLQTESKRIQQQIQAQQQLYRYLQSVQQRVALLRNSAMESPVAAVDVAAVVAASSQQLALHSSLQPQNASQDSVELVLQNIPFNQLMYWLAVLQQQHGVVVSALDMQRAEIDTVNGHLTLAKL